VLHTELSSVKEVCVCELLKRCYTEVLHTELSSVKEVCVWIVGADDWEPEREQLFM